MPRYAAIDIGSNSLRLLVADTTAGRPMQNLAAERQVTRLGESVFRTGRISKEAITFVCQQLARFAEEYKRHEVLAVRAVATSAVRDSSNRLEFLQRASQAAAVPVEIISGQEEARLIHMGVQALWPHPDKRIVILDVGGGSAEVILSENGRMEAAFSKPLGAVRLTEVFLKSDPPTEQELHRLDQFIDEKLAAPLNRIGHGPFDRMIATSATAAAIVSAVNRIPRPRRDEADRRRATVGQVRKFYAELSKHSLAGRRKMQGVGPRRAEIVIGGAAVFLRAMAALGQPSLYYSSAGVREGIVADLAARRVGRELSQLSREQRQTVAQLAKRCGIAPKHSQKVAELAHELFVGLMPLHRLTPVWGKLLEASAYLHDVGHFISDTGHHKHSYYIVQNADLAGFTDFEQHFIALLCRYHRKTAPVAGQTPLEAADAESVRALELLTPLLRVADSLDRSQEQKIEHVVCETSERGVRIGLRGRGDASLEIWAAERIAPLFEQVYGRPLTFVRQRI
ncbi:MAG: Ppx/GppA phosphatase family protein [Bryobacteraceae bacterium]